MGRFQTALAAAAAAGLSALAVTVAAPANDNKPGDKVQINEGPTPEALTACLEGHGATGLPDANAGEGRALKQWIVAHQSDESVRGALKACDVWFDDKRPPNGKPDDAVACPKPAPAGRGTADRKARRARVVVQQN